MDWYVRWWSLTCSLANLANVVPTCVGALAPCSPKALKIQPTSPASHLVFSMPTVQELEEMFEGLDSSDEDDDAGDEDYRDDDDQAPVQQRPRRRVHESDEEKEEEKEVDQTGHVPDGPDHVEEDGHVPEDGQNYREPRPPFTGTI